jgi:UDP-arabinose 4-epimerase
LNILVTGGAGYIGSHTCKLLAALGHLPVTYDNLSRGHRSAVRWGPIETGDILDRAQLRRVIDRYQPAAIMHFAALAYVGESVGHPLLYYRSNVAGSVALLEAAVQFREPRGATSFPLWLEQGKIQGIFPTSGSSTRGWCCKLQ